MDDPINEMPDTDWRIAAAAMYLHHHPEICGGEIYRVTRGRWGLTADETHQALARRDAYRFGWPILGKR